jgi:hypothetical protein
MSREDSHREFGEKTRELLRRSLKHVRAGALAAALAPMASPGCPPAPVPSPCDFITGGGFVVTDSPPSAQAGAQANFGSHGGCKNGAFWGHVNYVDHGGYMGVSPYHVDSTEITAYGENPASPNAREICGFATTNAGETVQFRVRMEDNDDTGTNDTFGIALSNGYILTHRPLGNGDPGGGNIELHKPNPSTTAPTSPPDCGGLPTP